MCTINKMLIKGIRSFDPDNKDVIEFFKPLTLIVGANGSGKTTIIESLKMATTGEVPPNTNKGESFVHDPKISNDTETKAQIKLRFDTVDGQSATAIRSMQVSKKGKKLQYKTLDNALQRVNGVSGDTERVSFRNADMDMEVAKMMGVSKAVLENVIFVHQDDSNWPLAEPAVLKKKFDDIFEATKFTAALDALKKTRKEQADALKESKLRLQTISRDRDNANKLRAAISQADAKIQQLAGEIEKAEATIEKADGELSAHQDELEELRKAERDVSIYESKVHDKERALQDATETCAEVADDMTTEQLQKASREFVKRVRDLESEQERNKRDLSTCSIDLESFKGQHAKQSRALGKAQADAEAARGRQAELDASLAAACRQLGLPTLGTLPLPKASVEAGVAQLAAEVSSQRERLRDHRAKAANEAAAMSAKVDAAAETLAGATETARMKKEAAEAELAREAQLRTEMREGENAVRAVERLENEAEKLSQQVEAKRNQLSSGDYDAQIAEIEKIIRDASAEISALQKEQQNLMTAQQANARLHLTEQQKDRLDSAAASSLQKACDAASSAGVEADAGDTADALLRRVRAEIARLKEQRKTVDADASTARRAAESAAGRVEDARRVLSSRKEECTSAREEVTLQTGAASISEASPEALHDARQRFQAATTELEYAKATKSVFANFTKKIKEDNRCPCCARAFADVAEREKTAADLDRNLRSLPAKVMEREKLAAAAKGQVEILEKVEPLLRRVEELEMQIPEARQALDDAEQAQAAAQEAADAAETTARKVTDDEEKLRDVLPLAEGAERAALEARHAAADLATLRRELGSGIGRPGRDVSVVAEEIHDAEEKRDGAQRKRDFKMQQFSSKKDELSQLEREHASARQRVSDEKHKAAERMNAARGAEEAANNAATLKLEAAQADEAAARYARERTDAANARDAAAADSQAEERRIVELLTEVESSQNKISSLAKAVAADEAAGRTTGVERERERLEKLNAQEAEAARRRADAQAKVDSAVQSLAEMAQTRRNLEDNLKLRQLRGELDALREKTAAARVRASPERARKLGVMLKNANKEAVAARQARDQQRGAMEAIQAGRQESAAELADRQYVDVDDKYRDMLVQLTSAELACADLDKYMKALDRALTSFHQQKMAEINSTIKELWQSVYRNQDIDKLEIRSDVDEGTNARGRSHNYRVVRARQRCRAVWVSSPRARRAHPPCACMCADPAARHSGPRARVLAPACPAGHDELVWRGAGHARSLLGGTARAGEPHHPTGACGELLRHMRHPGA